MESRDHNDFNEEKKAEHWNKYQILEQIAVGSFGVVFKAINTETRELVAIKKIQQDPRYKTKELKILQRMHHPNIVSLKSSFYSKEEEEYLNLVMDYYPETLTTPIANSSSNGKIPEILVKLYIYQLLRALAHIHSLRICHRDVKPLNLLLDSKSHIVSLCDFGSAKRLKPNESNISYICSRYYRAPELIFGSTSYNEKVDIWSVGCIAAELLLGHAIFAGESRIAQLIEIVKVLGTPSREQIHELNPEYGQYRFPYVKVTPLNKTLQGSTKNAIEFISGLLQYSPNSRPNALEALVHPFFDELRNQGLRLPNGNPVPDLFNWTSEERSSVNANAIDRLTPSWYRNN